MHARELPDAAWSTRVTVRFSDCDPAGIVYTPNFINLANGVIEDFFKTELKIDYGHVIGVRRVGLGYASVDCDFFCPAMMGDRLVFTPIVRYIGRTSIIYTVHCHRDLNEVMRCHMVMVTTSLNTHPAIGMPSDIRDALVAYQENCIAPSSSKPHNPKTS